MGLLPLPAHANLNEYDPWGIAMGFRIARIPYPASEKRVADEGCVQAEKKQTTQSKIAVSIAHNSFYCAYTFAETHALNSIRQSVAFEVLTTFATFACFAAG